MKNGENSKIENTHYLVAAFFAQFAWSTLKVSAIGIVLSLILFLILVNVPACLAYPELGLLDQLALLDFKTAGIVVAIIAGFSLVIAVIEFLVYK